MATMDDTHPGLDAQRNIMTLNSAPRGSNSRPPSLGSNSNTLKLATTDITSRDSNPQLENLNHNSPVSGSQPQNKDIVDGTSLDLNSRPQNLDIIGNPTLAPQWMTSGKYGATPDASKLCTRAESGAANDGEGQERELVELPDTPKEIPWRGKVLILSIISVLSCSFFQYLSLQEVPDMRICRDGSPTLYSQI